jgi:hypothetical protein
MKSYSLTNGTALVIPVRRLYKNNRYIQHEFFSKKPRLYRKYSFLRRNQGLNRKNDTFFAFGLAE